MKTKKDIVYRAYPYGYIATIPAGTEVIAADNLPETSEVKYWVEPWDGMNDNELSWMNNYGYGLSIDEVEGDV